MASHLSMITGKSWCPLTSLAKCAGVVLLIGFLPSCDSTEDDPWYLNLAGRYTGELTITTVAESVSGFMTVTVEQSGDQVTLSSTVHLLGQSLPLAAITGTVNSTGFFTLTGGGYSGSFDSPDCGAATVLSESINFFENESLEIVVNYTYESCSAESLKAVLHRS